MVDGTASGQIPNIVIQPQIPPSTPLEHPAQKPFMCLHLCLILHKHGNKKLKIKTYDCRCVDFSHRNQLSFQTSHYHDATHPHFIFHPDQNITVQGKCLDVAGKQKQDYAMMPKLIIVMDKETKMVSRWSVYS